MRRQEIKDLSPVFFCLQLLARVRVRQFFAPIGVNEIY